MNDCIFIGWAVCAFGVGITLVVVVMSGVVPVWLSLPGGLIAGFAVARLRVRFLGRGW